ncbi:DUF4129 domain-containing protein [Kribbella deserti]|uniref:DUF4129 domain-containing protein n=1 Tax=Kribbella deserti TaxID=1926257 RepID=A0ABV6QSP9_9ACTN
MMNLPLEPPIDISRDSAAEEAARELSKPVYHDDQSIITRALNKLLEWIGEAFAEMAVRSPGGRTGFLILLGLVVLAVVVIIWRAGVLRTTRAIRQEAVFDTGRIRSAAEYRAEAEAAAASGQFGPAIRSRFRAGVAELTERTILDDRAGRTAYEVAADATKAIPELEASLRPAATVFAEVVYGSRTATPERYAAVVAADEAARRVSTRSMLKATAG